MIFRKSKERKTPKLIRPKVFEGLDPDFDDEFGPKINLRSPQSDDYQNFIPESHEGRGPVTYQRPDMLILDDVVGLLTKHPEIDAREIEVQVNHGEVVLTGRVREEKMKFLATEVIKLLPGIRSVNNQLKTPIPK